VHWLKMLARFPHDLNTWLGPGHSMPSGDPPTSLSKQTKMNGLILLPPITVPSEFAALTMEGNRIVRFYSIVPLYQEELAYKLKYGTEALLDKLDKEGVNEIVDLQRKNVCKTSLLQFWKR